MRRRSHFVSFFAALALIPAVAARRARSKRMSTSRARTTAAYRLAEPARPRQRGGCVKDIACRAWTFGAAGRAGAAGALLVEIPVPKSGGQDGCCTSALCDAFRDRELPPRSTPYGSRSCRSCSARATTACRTDEAISPALALLTNARSRHAQTSTRTCWRPTRPDRLPRVLPIARTDPDAYYTGRLKAPKGEPTRRISSCRDFRVRRANRNNSSSVYRGIV